MNNQQDELAMQSSEEKQHDKNKSPDNKTNEVIAQLHSCQEENQAIKGKFVRVSADFENFRKRIEKERVQWALLGQTELLEDLLDVIDGFDRAIKHVTKTEKNSDKKVAGCIKSDLKPLLDGFFMINKSLYKILEKYGVMEITKIKKFDPVIHEAISQIESSDHESGDVVQVLQKGFMIKDKVLRPAKVSVAK